MEDKKKENKVSKEKETKSTPKADNKPKKDDKLVKLEKQVKELETKNDELSDKYMRSQAEIVNMRRRGEKEQAALIKYDGQKLAKSVLPALDNLERALAVEAQDEHAAQLKKGVEMVQKDILKALKENNITEIKAEGEVFDPTKHQAVQTVAASDEHKADTIVKVLQKGYILKDRVLRPAMVIVAQ